MPDVYTYVTDSGTIVPDASAIQSQVQQEYISAFGDDLNVVTPGTPQSLLIAVESLARIAAADNNAQLANQINPNIAGGVYLDAIVALLGASRTPATSSMVNCTLTGVSGTSIPAGAQISDANGNLYELVATTVIPLSGTIASVPFRSVLTGDVPGAAGTLITIVSNILGWETVTNPTGATLGTNTQSDAQLRSVRLGLLAAQGASTAEAIISALNAVPGMASVFFQENTNSSTTTIPPTSGDVVGVPMVRNSIYACVAGTSTNAAIGAALTAKKSAGCAYNTGFGIPQTVNVTDPFSGQVIPVKFDFAAQVTIAVQVTAHVYGNVGDPVTAVQNAILAYAAGQIPGEPGFVVGASVSPFQLAGAINILAPGIFVQEVQVGVFSFTQDGTVHNASTTVDGLTYNSAIVPGMTVTDTLGKIPNGTTVASLSGSNAIIITPSGATGNATEILTFAPASVSYQTTEIPIQIFQNAITFKELISVSIV